MKAKFYFIFLILNTVSFAAFSQPKANFEWSSYSRIKKYSQNIFISKTNTGYISITRNSNKFLILLYDSTLNIFDKFNFSISKNKETIAGIWYYEGKVFFLTQYILKNQRIALKTRVFDIINIKNFETELSLILVKNRFSRNLFFKFEEKDSTIEIFHPNVHLSIDENFSITYFTYSKNLKLLDRAIIELPVKYSLCDIVKAEKIDSTRFFLSTKQYYVRAIEKRGMSPNYYLGFYVLNPSKDKIDKYYLKNENVYLDVGRVRYVNGRVEATGFFSESLQGNKNGFWYMKYDFAKLKKECDTIVYFNQKTKELPTNGFHKSIFKKYSFESFYVDYLIREKKGEKIIVAEQFMLIPASFGSAYTYNRFYGDILILYLDDKLNIKNSQRLVKSQQTYNNTGEFSSYYLDRKDSILYFFYNDNINSVLKKISYQLVWHKHSCITLKKISENYNESFALADYSSVGGIVQLRDMVEIEENKYIVYARKKNKAKLGIMTFSE